MKTIFSFSVLIKVTTSKNSNTLNCRVCTGQIKQLSKEDESTISTFLERLLRRIVQSQEEKCGFVSMTGACFLIDDFEQAVYDGEFKPLAIMPIDKENVTISFAEGDDTNWCHPDIICDRIKYSLIAHILILSALEKILENVANEKKSEVFEEIRQSLRATCAGFVSTNDALYDEAEKIEVGKDENNLEFVKVLSTIVTAFAPKK